MARKRNKKEMNLSRPRHHHRRASPVPEALRPHFLLISCELTTKGGHVECSDSRERQRPCTCDPEGMSTKICDKQNEHGVETNKDDSPVKEIVKRGKVVAEIRNKEGILFTEENPHGSPVKEIHKVEK